MNSDETSGEKMNRELISYTAELSEEVGSDIDKLFSGQIDQARLYNIHETGLRKGDLAPSFSLPDTEGTIVDLKSLLSRGPVVLIFYRGGWCPYCNIQLRAYQRVLQEIRDLGAQIVAISPETVDHSTDTQQSESLEFYVLSDADNDVARRFQLAFPISPEVEAMFHLWGLDLDIHNGSPGNMIPVPATYVISKDGTVVFGRPDVDFRTRIEPEKVLAVLREIKV